MGQLRCTNGGKSPKNMQIYKQNIQNIKMNICINSVHILEKSERIFSERRSCVFGGQTNPVKCEQNVDRKTSGRYNEKK